MTEHAIDRNLLLVVMAFQLGILDRSQVVAAVNAWISNKLSSLGDILVDQEFVTLHQRSHLESMIDLHVEIHGGDLRKSLATVPGVEAVADALHTDSNPQLRAVAEAIAAATGAQSLSDTISIGQVTSRGERFRILRPHAQGGLGKVSVALDRELHREVALKEVRDDYAHDPTAQGRFLAEAEITGGLEHPGIVPVYGLGQDGDGRPFYAMRFIRGQSLQEAIDGNESAIGGNSALRDRPIELRKLVYRLLEVCHAIDYAHSRGVLHRDIKPSNIMLGRYGETLVVDWGLAKTVPISEVRDIDREPALQPVSREESGGETLMGEAVGSPPFMSPEQAAGRLDLLDAKTDVYGLGATLYFILTGDVPVAGSCKEEVHARVLRGDIRRPRDIDRRIPTALEAICLKAIALRPQDRYASARAIAEDLERWLADEPVLAFREPLLDRARRWARHHRVAVAVATALLICTTLALVIGNVMVRHERDIATKERDNARAARAIAEKANQHARQNAASTRQVVEQFLIQVADDRWSQIPKFESVRIEMVKLAVDRYRELLKQQPDDQSLHLDAAMAFRRSANLYRMVGRFELAQQLYGEAIDLMRRCIAVADQDRIAQQRLISLLSDAADLTLRRNGPVAAEGPFREAYEIAKEIRKVGPDSPGARKIEARTQLEYGEILRQQGRYDEALRLKQQAADTFRSFADDSPGDIVSRLLTVFALTDLGAVAREAGKMKLADEALTDSISRARANLKLNEREVNLRLTLASALLEMGTLRFSLDDPDAAAQRLDESITRLSELADEQESVASFRTRLAEALIVRGELLMAQNQRSKALEDAQRSLNLLTKLDEKEDDAAVYKKPLVRSHQLRARIYAAQGNTDLAREDITAAQQWLEAARKANPTCPQLSNSANLLESLSREISP